MQNRWRDIFIVWGFSLFCITQMAQGQFYNGLQMSFGKNRIQYARGDLLESDFFYSFYRFDRYDVYFYPNGQKLAEYVSKRAAVELQRLENFFEYSLNKRVIFLVFNKLNDFRQSNIGLVTGKEETNIGGVTKIIDNKVFVYFEGDYRKFDQQITAAITGVILQEMLYGGNVRQRVTSSTLLNLPEWYYKGLLAYVSKGWDVETDDFVRDGILSGKYKKFNQLTGEDAVYAGQSIWNFISETFGSSVISAIVYFTKVNRNVSAGFMNVLGLSLNALSYEWEHYYRTRYEGDAYQGEMPDGQEVKLKNRKNLKYIRTSISPDGRYIAYVSNQIGRIKVYLYDLSAGKSRVIYRTGAKLGQIEDYSYPVLAWHPTGALLAMISEYKGKIRFSRYPLETHKWVHDDLKLFEKVLGFSFADDGINIVVSAVVKGQSDLFIHNLAAHTTERLTDDRADDLSPCFADHSRNILFTSNRKFTNLDAQKASNETEDTYDLFLMHYSTHDPNLIRVAADPLSDHWKPFRMPDRSFVYLGDDNGIRNRYSAVYDSTIMAIDTTIHYRYFTNTRPVTRYPRNILDQSFSRNTRDLAQILRMNNRYRLYRDVLSKDSPATELIDTPVRKQLTRQIRQRDSLDALKRARIKKLSADTRNVVALNQDTSLLTKKLIDINHYIFEEERKIKSGSKKPAGDFLSRLRSPLGSRTLEFPKVRIYQPAFYINYLASLIDFNFLNASYQPFTGGAGFYNPGLNVMSKVGTQDLFEDYKLTGGVRFGGDFDSNEYLLSFENLKKRLDKEVIFHRMVYKTATYDYSSLVRSATQELMLLLKYPFSQVSSLRSTLTLRMDDYTFLSTDQKNLKEQGVSKLWSGLKLEYVYDNTLTPALNAHEGLRYKLFGEYYQQVNGNFSDVFIVGADIRHYLPIHRSLIWANRIAASTSFGGSRLIYYMGGVDNWINFSKVVPTFDPSVPIDTTQNFVYQALATNMRGFSQNVRNGNSFVVWNTELRWPVFRYFANRPINSDFLSNFQLIGFFDLGTAWTGPTPWDKRNHLNREVIEKGPVRVVIEKANEPLVAGFGYGVRSRLLGYYIRLDWAWGIENYVILPRVFYLSLSLDF